MPYNIFFSCRAVAQRLELMSTEPTANSCVKRSLSGLGCSSVLRGAVDDLAVQIDAIGSRERCWQIIFSHKKCALQRHFQLASWWLLSCSAVEQTRRCCYLTDRNHANSSASNPLLAELLAAKCSAYMGLRIVAGLRAASKSHRSAAAQKANQLANLNHSAGPRPTLGRA